MPRNFYIGLLTVLALLSHSLSADEHQLEKLRDTIDSTLEVIYSDSSANMTFEEKQAEVRKRIEANYDLDVIIRRAIGLNWERMNASEQEKVLELVKQLVVKSYVKSLEGAERPQVALGEVSSITERRIEIQSTITMGNKTFSVLYRLGRMSSGWQIYDIVAENISVVSNYRQQINDHFRGGSGAQLITRLEELIARNEIDEDIQI